MQKLNQVVERKNLEKLDNWIDGPVEFDDRVNNLLESYDEYLPEEVRKTEEEMKRMKDKTKKKSKEVDSEGTEKRLSANISKLEYDNVIDLSKLDIGKLLTEEFPKPAIKPDGLNDRRDGDYKKMENSGNDEKLKSFAAQMSNNNYPNQYGKEDEFEEPVPQNFNEIFKGYPNQYGKIEDEFEEPVPQNLNEILKGLKSKDRFIGQEIMDKVEGFHQLLSKLEEPEDELEEEKSIVGSKVLQELLISKQLEQKEEKNNNHKMPNRGTDYSSD